MVRGVESVTRLVKISQLLVIIGLNLKMEKLLEQVIILMLLEWLMLFQQIKNEVVWIEIKAGEVLVFNQNLPHGNRVNKTSETRWSMNCRFKSVFTPYGDKKLGEFFEPITLKAASRLGMAYQFPSLHSDPEE